MIRLLSPLGLVLLLGCAASTPPPAAPESVAWDAAAAEALRAQVTKMAAAFDAGDLAAAKEMFADDAGPLYDFDFEGKPIRFNSRDEAFAAYEQMMAPMKSQGASMKTELGAVHCGATASFGVCTIEADQTASMPGQPAMTVAMRATVVARKGADGWKWLHLHGSLAKPLPEPPPPACPPPPAPPPEPVLAPGFAVPKDLKWVDIPGIKGATMAVVWKHPTSGATAFFGKMPKGLSIPRHYHTGGQHLAIVEGSLTLTDADGTAHEVGKGGWFFEAPKVVHSVSSKQGALAFVVTTGAFETVMVDEQGNPLPAKP